jgi:hypothetical protein
MKTKDVSPIFWPHSLRLFSGLFIAEKSGLGFGRDGGCGRCIGGAGG